jgi:hypothetical protein
MVFFFICVYVFALMGDWPLKCKPLHVTNTRTLSVEIAEPRREAVMDWEAVRCVILFKGIHFFVPFFPIEITRIAGPYCQKDLF